MSPSISSVLAPLHDHRVEAVLAVRNDATGTIDYANPAAGRLFARPVAELVSLSIEQLTPRRFRTNHAQLRHAMITEPMNSRSRPHRVVQGLIGEAERLLVVDVEPCAGQPDHLLATVRPLEVWVDTTAWMVSAFEHSPTAVALVELTEPGERIIRAANAALGELVGYDVADLLGMGFDELTFDDDENDDRSAASAMAMGTTDRYTRRKRYRHRDGHPVWCDLSSRRLPNDGHPVLALAHLTDVSAQVELAELHRDTETRLRSEVAARTRALAESTQQLRQSLVAASMASWTYDVVQDRFSLVADDRSWPELRQGRTAAHVLAMLHPEDAGSLTEAVRSAAGWGRSFDLTLRSRSDLARHWVRIAGDAVADADGSIERVIGVVQDVTPIQALIDDLRRSERQLSLSVHAAGIGTWVTDFVGGDEHYDATTRHIFGIDDEPITTGLVLSRVHPDDRHQLLDGMRRVVAEGTPLMVTLRLGEAAATRWVRWWSEPVLGVDGATEGIVGVVQDITDERGLVEAAQTGERMLRESEDHLRLVLAATTTGTWDWNIADGTIAFSREWLDHLGHDDAIAAGFTDDTWSWQRLIHPDEWPESERRLVDHFEQRTPFCECEHRLLTGDGSWRWYRSRARIVERDAAGRPLRMIGAAMDISGQRRLEDQLVHGAKMQALGAFAGSVAHDFNNVMAIVRGHVELLRRPPGDTPPDPDGIERRLAAIEQSVDRASSFVRQLMTLGRPTDNRPADIDLAAFVIDLAPTLAQFLGEDIAFEVDAPGIELPVRIDGGRLEALLLNLAANARDAMVSGGTVTIALRTSVSDEGERWANMEVRDTGVGMDAATIAAAFEPFFTTKAPGVGTGLGLANAMATVGSAGGSIDVSSTVGVGTTMMVSLPMATTSTRTTLAGPALRATRPSGTVLLVEDEADLLEVTADAVRARGHRVHCALSGAEAIEILESDAIDIVVTDAVMAGMSGAELAATVTRRWPDIPILFVTGYASGDEAVPTASAADTLAKPVPHDVLLEAIESRLGTGADEGPRG